MTARILTATALVAVVAAGGLAGIGSASAGTYVYDLSAEAVAVQSTLTDPNTPLGLPFSVGSYGAGALLSSSGESTADAGAPYSPLLSTFPATGNGLVQSASGVGLPVVPSFPGYVRAKDPVLPLDKQTAGGYELVASALPKQAVGKVSIGGQAATSEQNNAFAVANSVAGDDHIFTEGAAGVHALTLEGILDVFNVSSYASLTQTAGGSVVPRTTTSLGTITFSRLTSGLTKDGLTAFGSEPTPLDVSSLGALNEALKPAGITLTYLPEQYRYTDGTTSTGPKVNERKTVAGVTSGALRIAIVADSDRGTTTETLTVGQVTLAASGNALNATGSGISAGGTVGTGVSPGSAGGVDSVVGDLGTDLAGAPGAGVPATGVVPSDAVPTQNFVPAVAAGGTILDEGRTDFGSFYVFLALAALVALGAGQAVRVLAVRRSA